MVEIKFLGACNEVGRSGVQLTTEKDRFLFDYGYEVQYGHVPIQPNMPLSGVFISHAHIDHSGMVPHLYSLGYKGSVYTTEATAGIMEILLRDSIKVQKKRGEPSHFTAKEIETTLRLNKNPRFGEPVQFKDSTISFMDAGHIPGAAATVLESGGKKIMYTGDIKFIDTLLVGGAQMDCNDLDAVLIESTYSYKEHPDRAKIEDELRELVQETVYNNGTMIIPSFAVGRTQEMLLILHDLGFPMYVDGMGIGVTNTMLQHPGSLHDPGLLRKAFGKATKVHGMKDRKAALQKPGIIITTAGMLSGGPVGYYIRQLHNKENCTMCLTGYQVEGTVGRHLMDTGRYVHEDFNVKPKMRIEAMDFSAHTDKGHTIEWLKKNNPTKVFCMHGDRTKEFAKELKELGFDAHAPTNGEKLKI
jgi:putative mRNA 3-end processing factor